jgi:2-C-methyl-D-erythritol 2,4-cyclodiphosphate synthase
MNPIRIGFGYDVHRLAKGDVLFLGGIQIASHLKSVAHSDGDVLIHAICDALLGALSLRDIGYHFSDKDAKYKGIDSKILLKEVLLKIKSEGYRVGNIDATVVLEAPKINPPVESMQSILADILEVSIRDVSIKATTNETIGFVGREEGIAAYAVALLYKISQLRIKQ